MLVDDNEDSTLGELDVVEQLTTPGRLNRTELATTPLEPTAL